MFVKMSILKKMMKDAYKAGCLIVGNAPVFEEDSDGLIIAGGWWAFGIEYMYAPKELKAAVMELGGELPYDNHCYRALNSGNQEHIGFTEHSNPAILFRNCKYDLTISKILVHFLDDGIRLLQNNLTQKVVGIKNTAIKLVDKTLIDYDGGEYEPIGPKTAGDDIVCWGNNMCYLAIWPYKLLDEDAENDKKKFFKTLEQIKLLN